MSSIYEAFRAVLGNLIGRRAFLFAVICISQTTFAAPSNIGVFDFANNGKIGDGLFPTNTTGKHAANASPQQSYARLIRIGDCLGLVANKGYFCVNRINADGSRNTSFPFALGKGAARTSITDAEDDVPEAIGMQPDGKRINL